MENFGEGKKSKKSKGLLIVLLLIIIAVAALAAYYALTINTDRYIFDKQISKILSGDTEITDYNTVKTTFDVTAKINSDDEDLKEVSDLINDAKLTVASAVDTENKEEVVGLKLVKASDELLDVKAKVEEESQTAYVSLGELFDKTIKIDLAEILDEEFSIEDTNISSIGQMVNAQVAQNILKDEVKSQLKDEYFSSEKVSVEGKNLTKNEIKLSSKELVNVLKTIFKDLSENDEFLSCYENKDEVKNTFKDAADAMDELETDEDVYIILDIYTSGIMKKVERVDFIVDEDGEKAIIQFRKIDDGKYSYKLLEDDEEFVEGELKFNVDKNNYTFEISVKYEGTEVALNLTGTVVYDEELDSIKTKDAVSIADLSQEDMYEIIGNFSESKLYQIIEGVSGSYESDFELDDDDDEYDYTFTFDEDEEDLDDEDEIKDDDKENDEKEESKSSKKSSSSANNIVKTFDGDEIKFNIPNGFEIYSGDSDSYKLFEKETDDGDIDVDVSASYETLDEYIESIKSKAKRYEESKEYSNITVSEPETIEVGENEFTKVTLKYDYELFSTVTYVKTYYAYEINSEYLYTVEIDGADLISDKETETFLTIEK